MSKVPLCTSQLSILVKLTGIELTKIYIEQDPPPPSRQVLVSHPALLARTASLLLALRPLAREQVVCGVPYTALPIATLMSVEAGVPMVVRRKEAKDYGTKKMVEGVWTEGQNCVVVEDVVTTGGSVLETAEMLRREGMEVTECVVLLDREQGAVEALAARGVAARSVLRVSGVLEVLERRGRITGVMADRVAAFLAGHQAPPQARVVGLRERLEVAGRPLARRLLQAVVDKQSNLCVSIDCTSQAEVLRVAEAVGPEAVVVKLHRDVVADWTEGTARRLAELGAAHGFLLLEDRKLADIGNTVRLQAAAAAGGWAELVTVHGVAGPGTLEGLAAACGAGVGALLVAEMSCRGNLAVGEYTRACLGLGGHPLVAGYIGQSPLDKVRRVVEPV